MCWKWIESIPQSIIESGRLFHDKINSQKGSQFSISRVEFLWKVYQVSQDTTVNYYKVKLSFSKLMVSRPDMNFCGHWTGFVFFSNVAIGSDVFDQSDYLLWFFENEKKSQNNQLVRSTWIWHDSQKSQNLSTECLLINNLSIEV